MTKLSQIRKKIAKEQRGKHFLKIFYRPLFDSRDT